jgi:hypothetical protein
MANHLDYGITIKGLKIEGAQILICQTFKSSKRIKFHQHSRMDSFHPSSYTRIRILLQILHC